MPAPAGVLAPLLLAGVLLLSAVAKWRAPESTRSAIILLRLPRWLHGVWVAKALPVGEALLALAMLAPWLALARIASWAAVLLFLTYFVVIARAMTFSPRPNCGCFGKIGDQRVRAKTVWRNGVFLLLAGLFAWFTAAGSTVPATLASMGGTGWGWLVVAGLVAAGSTLIGGSAAGEPPIGQAPVTTDDDSVMMFEVTDPEEYVRKPIPTAMLVDPEGKSWRLAEMAQQRAQLLVFVNCYCGPSHIMARSIPQWRAEMPALDVHLVFSHVPPMEHTDEAPTNDAWTDPSSVTWSLLGLRTSPSAVLLGADGLLAGGPVGGTDDIIGFVEEISDALGHGLPEAEPSDNDHVSSSAMEQLHDHRTVG